MKHPMYHLCLLASMIPQFRCKPGCHDCCDKYHSAGQPPRGNPGREGMYEFTTELRFDSLFRPDRRIACFEAGKCYDYLRRPVLCRLFGSTILWPCPHGFGPEKPMSAVFTQLFMRMWWRIRRQMVGSKKSIVNDVFLEF